MLSVRALPRPRRSCCSLGRGLKLADRPAHGRAALATYGDPRRAARDASRGRRWSRSRRGSASGVAGGRRGRRVGRRRAARRLRAAQARRAGCRAARGAPCGCFGARGRVGRGVARRAPRCWRPRFAVAAAAAAREPTTEGWLRSGSPPRCSASPRSASPCSRSRARSGAAARVGPQGALEVAHEGPELGARTALAERFATLAPGRIALAVFTSEGCGMCRALAPAVARFGRDPRVALRTFDEVARRRRLGGRRRARQPVRGRARRRRHRARQGHVQHRRAARVRARGRRAPARGRAVPEPARRATGRGGTSRRGFLARVGGARDGARGRADRRLAVAPGEAEAYHFCGHIYTTDSCPHPTGLPRIDRAGFPLRAQGRPAGRRPRPPRSTRDGRPVDEDGQPLTDPDGRPLPARAAHAGLRRRSASATASTTQIDGAWYRCCGGHVRKLVDCCSLHPARASTATRALTGYCYKGRKVFCVMYFQTKVPC